MRSIIVQVLELARPGAEPLAGSLEGQEKHTETPLLLDVSTLRGSPRHPHGTGGRATWLITQKARCRTMPSDGWASFALCCTVPSKEHASPCHLKSQPTKSFGLWISMATL